MSLVSQFSWDSVYYKYKSGLHWELTVATSWSERHVSSFAAWENEFDAVLRGQICKISYDLSSDYLKFIVGSTYSDLPSAGVTMWQMRQMPRASGLRGPPEVEKIFFSPSVVK